MLKTTEGFKAFAKAAFRNPMSVSTFFPSLRFLSQAMIQHSGVAEGDHVLELGAGSGAITKHIMKERNKLASYTGVEIDPNLVDYLKASFPGEKFLAASAENLKDHVPDQSIDVVMCSLPWTLFPEKLQESITKEIVRVLKPGGHFTTFLCVHALTYPGAPRAKKIFNQSFSDFGKKAFIPHNIPPANVYRGTKPLLS